MRSARRAGFSLVELLLATSVLLGCIVVLAELAALGAKHVGDIEGLSTSQLICQSTLNEMLSSAAPVEAFQQRPVDGQPGWMVSAQIDTVEQSRVASLRVTAWYEDPVAEGLDSEVLHRHEFTLVRWIRDPYRQDAANFETGPFESPSLFEPFDGGWLP